MAEHIIFGPEPKSNILTELEALRENCEVDQMIARAQAPDSNVFILEEVLTCVKNGAIKPVKSKDIMTSLDSALGRKIIIPTQSKAPTSIKRTPSNPANAFAVLPESDAPRAQAEDPELPSAGLELEKSRSSSRFLFVHDVLPGNGKAESVCASFDGMLHAYLTYAAVRLQDVSLERLARARLYTSPTPDQPLARPQCPQMVNITSFDPYEAWSVPITPNIPDAENGSFELSGLDRTRLYLSKSRGNHKLFFELDLHDGNLIQTYDLGDHCGAVFLDVSERRLTFIDLPTATLNILDLEKASSQSYFLDLPPGLHPEALQVLEFTPDGTFGIILVAPSGTASGVLLGVVRLSIDRSASDPAFSIRWLERNELWLNKGFEKARFSFLGLSQEGEAPAGAFYLVDATNTIHTLPVARLDNVELGALDPLTLLSSITATKGCKKTLFPVLAVGTERPLMATYDQTTERLKLWDTSANVLLISIPCPFHVDRLDFLAHDTLLATKSRTCRGVWDDLSLTFIDLLLLAGQSPSTLTEDHLPLLDPLSAWTPDSTLLDFMKRLCVFNTQGTKEVVA